MKKYLIDPRKLWCKANFHCHTNISDGAFTPAEIKELYKKQGYKIVAYSDHKVIVDNSYLCDDDFVALTAVEYNMEGGSWTADKWQDTECIHLNLFAKDPHNTFHTACSVKNIDGWQYEKYKDTFRCDGYTRVFTLESINETIKRANEAGFLVQYNHPNWSLNTQDLYLNLEGLWSVEILNYATEIESASDYCPYIYQQMLDNGKKLFCSMGDDNHNYGKSLVGSFGGFNYVGVDKLSYGNVMNAMEKGDFYCSSGPQIHALYIEGDRIFVECDPAENIVFTSRKRRFTNYAGKGLTFAEFALWDVKDFFRITVCDGKGGRAHTRAYFADEIEKLCRS
ncbi:MAG: hypothetical protein IK147_01105 [Clostridia bacterium]|nr:hypothetical protein [Clostridia bacterium]